MSAVLLDGLLVANLAASLFMTGLIWFVQIVHYPLFADTGEREFAAYEKRHAALTSRVVGPPMLIEAAAALGLVFIGRPGPIAWCSLGLLALIWASTAAIQVPCHTRLESGFDRRVHERLVRSNWIRTIAWTLRSGLALLLFFTTRSV